MYTGTVSSTSQDMFTVVDSIDALVDIKGYIEATNSYKFPFNYTQNDSTQTVVFLKPDSKTFAYRGTDTGTYYLVIEYTKTSDTITNN